MDESLRTAARNGDVNELYTLIQRNGNVLRRFDRVEFVNTPLHIAAEAGCMEFAMEIMSIKPSLARKLNHQGLSPLHLAIKEGHKEIALRLVEIDKDLGRVKGKNGETPLHYICKVGNHDGLLDKFLEACPDCIRDVTAKKRTAIHVAVESEKLDVLKILIRTLRKNDCFGEEVDRKDEMGNTALHIAASKNQPEILKKLLQCGGDKDATDQTGSTALEVAKRHGSGESVTILKRFSLRVLNFIRCKLKKRILKYATKASSIFFHDMDDISMDDRNALLVVLGLLLTATYQTTLSPPGGVRQGDSSTEEHGINPRVGTSVMDQFNFLLFYIPTYFVFTVTFFLTMALLKPFPYGFRTALQVLLAFLAICFDQSISFIAPTSLPFIIIKLFSGFIFILMVLMCISHKVSKLSIDIVGVWIFLPI